MRGKLALAALLCLGLALAATADRFQYMPLKKSKTYPLAFSANKSNPRLTDILVDLPEQNELKNLGAYADVYADHPHPAEYHQGSLYLLKKRQTSTGILTELWQHRGGKAELVHAAYDYLTFRVSPDDKYIAIFAGQKLYLLTADGEKKRTLGWTDFYPKNAPAKAQYYLTPSGWNDRSTELWFALKDAAGKVTRVFYLSALNWKYAAYDDLPLQPLEYALSPRGRIAYSDAGLNRRMNIFTLYTRDLRGKKTEIVATSNYRFEPEWRGVNLDFNSPRDGKKRVTRGE